MNWAWVAQMEALWRSPAFPMWAALTAAAFFGVVLLVTLLRADRSVANGALAIITLLAVGVAAAATVRGTAATPAAPVADAPLPVAQGALACLDGLAGDRIEAACEKALFASADSTAAAVSYTAAQISRLPVAASGGSPDLAVLRRVLERDRYGLAAQVLTAREGCTPASCETFRYLSNSSQIVANMNERAFETLVARYEPGWGGEVAAVPTGKPSDIDYPTAASIPPVSIMTSDAPAPAPRSEPATQAAAPAESAPAASPAPAAPPVVALPPNSVPFPNARAQQPAPPAAAERPAATPRRAASKPAPTKRTSTAPPPVQLVPQ